MYRDRFKRLVCSAKGDADVLSIIEDAMNSFSHYVNTVYSMEIHLQTLRFRLEGDAYRDAVMELDRRRHSAHEAAIASCAVINRVADRIRARHLYTGNLENRYEVAEFCMAIVDEMFRGRTMCTISELLKSA